MKKIFLFIILTINILNAKTISANYQISYGIFQNLGTAKAFLNIDKNNNYIIRITANAEGMASVLSAGRIETYESKGKYINDFFIPDEFIKIRKNKFSEKISKYTFDHINKSIKLEKIIEGKSEGEEIYDYYAKEDLLSLFFNLKNYTDFKKNEKLYALGGKKGNGEINLIKMVPEETKKIKDKLDYKTGILFKVKIDQDIFSSKEGQLYINLDKNYLADKSILLDVFLFGDIVGKRIY